MSGHSASSLRAKYPEFSYDRFDWKVGPEGLTMRFFFSAGQLRYEAKTTISGVTAAKLAKVSRPAINNLVFHLGLAEIPSYWKATCSPTITIAAGALTPAQIKFWHKLLMRGMMQYFYENKIDFRSQDFVQIVSTGTANYTTTAKTASKRYLVAVGGGKDSAVALEVLRGNDFGTFAVNPGIASQALIALAGSHTTVTVSRQIDPKLLELNSEGYLNGHTPISSVFAVLALLCAYLFDFGQCVFANEASSNEGNYAYLGKEVNHQYSKTYEFEADMRAYSQKYLTNIHYFSLLRPLGDLAITRLFAGLPAYHQAFLSCNVGARQGKWCGKCAKCLSTFILLSPFVNDAELVKIFGHNLFADKSLLPLLADLVDPTRVKPFECVGTRQELQLALAKAASTRLARELPLLAWAQAHLNFPKLLAGWKSELATWGKSNFVPSGLAKCLKHLVAMPLPILRLAGKEVAILGFGVEGKSVYTFLRSYLPDKKLTIVDKRKLSNFAPADAKLLQADPNLSLRLGQPGMPSGKFDVVVKSPGIPESSSLMLSLRSQTDTQITSVMRLFFELVQGQTVGVTGTVGKTTTVNLIYHAIKSTGKDAVLVGNVGQSPLELLSSDSPDRIWVCELSSYQLSDLGVSPHVAVWLNIFEEHLDYHGDFAAYFEAKKRIAKFQREADVFIYNRELPKLAEFAKSVKSHQIGFGAADFAKLLGGAKTKLVGAHNKLNILAAYRAVSQFGVTLTQFKKALATFSPVAHRLETVRTLGKVRFVDDSISTVPQSTLAAMEALKDEPAIVLILGGMDRGVSLLPLKALADYPNLKGVVLAGQTADKLESVLANLPAKVVNLGMVKMAKVVPAAAKLLGTEGVVLLSPAATSFDMYRDYVDRSEQFKAAAKKIT